MRYLLVMQSMWEYEERDKFAIPLGLPYINGALRAAGFEVYGICLPFYKEPFKALKQIIRDKQINVVLCGGLTIELPKIKRVFDTVKSIDQDIITIGGGGGFTSEPIRFCQITNVDYAVIGEGEVTNVELAGFLEHGGRIEDIDGIVYKTEAGYQLTKPRKAIKDMDSIPFPSYEGFSIEEYLDQQASDGNYHYYTYYSDAPRIMPMLMARSCPHNCSFCFHPIGNKYRVRSLDNFFLELDMLIDKYHINGIALVDECFAIDRRRVLEFCKRIKPYRIVWACQMRADIFDAQVMEEMKAAGCIGAFFGIESMSEKVLVNMNKKITISQIERAILLAKEKQVGCMGNLIFGAENETLDTVRESLDWLAGFRREQGYSPIKYFGYIETYPGSAYYRHACETGKIPNPTEYIEKNHFILNITGMSDEEYDLVGYFTQLKQRELQNVGTLLYCQKETGGRYALTLKCSHCGAVHTYRNIQEKRVKSPVLKNFGCRSCNMFSDYVIREEEAPHRPYRTIDWFYGRVTPDWRRLDSKPIYLAGYPQLCQLARMQILSQLPNAAVECVEEQDLPRISSREASPWIVQTDLLHSGRFDRKAKELGCRVISIEEML